MLAGQETGSLRAYPEALYELDQPGDDLRERLRALWRRRLAVASIAAVALAAAAAATFLPGTAYRSTTKIVVTQGNTLPAPSPRTGEQPYAATLAQLARTEIIATNIVQNLRLTRSPRDLLDDLHVTVDPQTSIVAIAADDSDPTRARQIAQEAAIVFSQLVTERLGNPAGGARALGVSIWEPATEATRVGRHVLRNLLLGLALGLLLGALTAFARERRDPRARTAAELERAFGAPVVGEVPAADDGEAYGNLARTLRLLAPDRPAQALLLAGEPGLAVARRLAGALARAGERPVVVDATSPGEDGRRGLTEVLAGELELEQALVPGEEGVAFLPAGAAAPDRDGLLGSSLAGELVDRLAAAYGRVLVAGPPATASATDAVLVAVGPRGAPLDDARVLRELHARVAGIVLVRDAAPAAPQASPPAGEEL